MPDDVTFQTKPQLARALLARALDAGVPPPWVTADAVYGANSHLRRMLEGRGQCYVLAVASNVKPSTWPPYAPPGQVAVAHVAAALRTDGWRRLSCGDGAQGPRVDDWAYVPLRPALRDGWRHGVLVPRHPSRTDEMAYYLVYAPNDTVLEEIVRTAGSRWAVEDTFKLAKGQVGLDHYEVRSWSGWHRHTTLALWALALLAAGVTGASCAPRATYARKGRRAWHACCQTRARPTCRAQHPGTPTPIYRHDLPHLAQPASPPRTPLVRLASTPPSRRARLPHPAPRHSPQEETVTVVLEVVSKRLLWVEEAQADEGAREGEEGLVESGLALVADREAAVTRKPGQRAFDDPATVPMRRFGSSGW